MINPFPTLFVARIHAWLDRLAHWLDDGFNDPGTPIADTVVRLVPRGPFPGSGRDYTFGAKARTDEPAPNWPPSLADRPKPADVIRDGVRRNALLVAQRETQGLPADYLEAGGPAALAERCPCCGGLI